VGQRRHGKLLLVAENRTDRQKGLPDADAARADVFDDIERFYHTIRRHSTIGYLSLVEFERKVGLAQLPAAAQTACAAN
jgi:transposase InsO family protein